MDPISQTDATVNAAAVAAAVVAATVTPIDVPALVIYAGLATNCVLLASALLAFLSARAVRKDAEEAKAEARSASAAAASTKAEVTRVGGAVDGIHVIINSQMDDFKKVLREAAAAKDVIHAAILAEVVGKLRTAEGVALGREAGEAKGQADGLALGRAEALLPPGATAADAPAADQTDHPASSLAIETTIKKVDTDTPTIASTVKRQK